MLQKASPHLTELYWIFNWNNYQKSEKTYFGIIKFENNFNCTKNSCTFKNDINFIHAASPVTSLDAEDKFVGIAMAIEKFITCEHVWFRKVFVSKQG